MSNQVVDEVTTVKEMDQHNYYVTGFAKTVPIGTTIEIHFMA